MTKCFGLSVHFGFARVLAVELQASVLIQKNKPVLN